MQSAHPHVKNSQDTKDERNDYSWQLVLALALQKDVECNISIKTRYLVGIAERKSKKGEDNKKNIESIQKQRYAWEIKKACEYNKVNLSTFRQKLI